MTTDADTLTAHDRYPSHQGGWPSGGDSRARSGGDACVMASSPTRPLATARVHLPQSGRDGRGTRVVETGHRHFTSAAIERAGSLPKLM